VLVWHYHDDDVSGPEAEVELTFSNLPLVNGKAQLQHFRVDQDHSNAHTVWQRMGAPQQPTAGQYAQLEKAGQLAALGAPETMRIMDGKTALRITLPRQAVSLLQLVW